MKNIKKLIKKITSRDFSVKIYCAKNSNFSRYYIDVARLTNKMNGAFTNSTSEKGFYIGKSLKKILKRVERETREK